MEKYVPKKRNQPEPPPEAPEEIQAENPESSHLQDNPWEEVFVQRGVYAPVTPRDLVEAEMDKIPLAQKEADRQVFKMILLLCVCTILVTNLSNFLKQQVKTTSVYQTGAGDYIVGKEEVRCPDGTICTYLWTGGEFRVRYPNGFVMTVTPVGKGGGITSYTSQQSAPLTDEIRASQVQVKNAILEHYGFVTDLSPWKLVSLPVLLLAMMAIITPYKISDFLSFLWFRHRPYFHSLECYSKIQKGGIVVCLISFVVLI